MKKTTHFQVRQQPLITRQDIIYVLILIAISFIYCLIPLRGFGQSLPGSDNLPVLGSAPDSAFPPTAATNPEPAPLPVSPAIPEPPLAPAALVANPPVEQFYAPSRAAIPSPATAVAAPVTANAYTAQPPQLRNPQRETVGSTEHPFRQYWGVSNDPQTKITGKPMTVAELLTGTRSSAVRCQLLQAYWELSGLWAIYHFRCETEMGAGRAGGVPQDNMLTLLREQRRTAEVEFIKQQWVLAELLKQCKGRTFRESDLPIPADFPLCPRYQTFASKIARSDRAQYLGRMIPIQEQLIESKNSAWKAATELTQNAAQPFVAVAHQRTAAFLDLTKAITEYNKMIAEYAVDTIPPNVSPHLLVAAVVRQPNNNVLPRQARSSPKETQEITLTQFSVQHDIPKGVAAQPVEQMGYEFQVPVGNRTQSDQFEDVDAPKATAAFEQNSASALMLTF